jgi:hypothetical protein
MRNLSRRGATWMISLAFIAVIGISASRVFRPGSTSPRLDLGTTPSIDLGEGKPGEILTGTFLLGNSGGAPLTFKLLSGCACSQLDPSEGEVQPGEYRRIKVGVRLRGEGQDEHVRIHIETGTSNTADFWAHAHCPAVLVVTPQAVDFGTVLLSKSKNARIHVSRADGKLFRSASDLKVASPDSQLTLAQELTQSGGIDVTVALRGSTSVGWFRKNVSITFPERQRTIEIPVSGEVCGALKFAPHSVRIPLQATAKNHRSETIMVWRTDGGALGKLARFSASSGIILKELPASDSKRRLFSIGVDGSPRPGKQVPYVHMDFDVDGVREEVMIGVVTY